MFQPRKADFRPDVGLDFPNKAHLGRIPHPHTTTARPGLPRFSPKQEIRGDRPAGWREAWALRLGDDPQGHRKLGGPMACKSWCLVCVWGNGLKLYPLTLVARALAGTPSVGVAPGHCPKWTPITPDWTTDNFKLLPCCLRIGQTINK